MRSFPSLVSILGVVSILSAQEPPAIRSEVEPNHVPAQAQAITLGDEVAASLTAGDADWYRLSLGSAGLVQLYSNGNTTPGGTTATDTKFELYDGSGATLLAVEDDHGGALGAGAGLHCNLDAGIYLLKVTGSGPSVSGIYVLETSVRACITATTAEAAEPNALGGGTPTLVNGTNWSVHGSIQQPGDEDWYQVTVAMPRANLHFELSGMLVPALGRTRLEFRTSTGAPVDASLGPISLDSGPKTATIQQDVCWPEGTYFVVVKAEPLGGVSATGNYRLACTHIDLSTDFTNLPPSLAWNEVAGKSPLPRANHAMTYDSARGKVVMFGGQNLNGYRGDTWERTGQSWVRRSTTGPEGRYGQAMCYDSIRGVVVLFGGFNGGGLQGDTWEWDGNVWSQRLVSGPSGRYGAVMAYDPVRSRTLLFGGTDLSGARGDTWQWDGTSWEELLVAGPSPRREHAMARDNFRDRIVLFGGSSGGHETWEWDGQAWSLRATSGPSSRSRHGLVYDSLRNRVILFGGYAGSWWSYSAVGDTWEWDGQSWNQPSVTGPQARQVHAMAFDASLGKAVVFGGWNDTIHLHDTWEWNGQVWAQSPELDPSLRSGHVMARDSARNMVVLFGGQDPTGLRGDTWEWDGQWWTERLVAGPLARAESATVDDGARGRVILFGGRSSSTVLGDTWSWNGQEWTPIAVAGPEARYRHAMACDGSRNIVVLFGGEGISGLLCDTWEWDGQSWLQRAASGPLPRRHHAMAPDTSRRRVVLFGGQAATGNCSDTWEWDGQTWVQCSVNGPGPRDSHAMTTVRSRGTIFLFGGRNGGAWLEDLWEWDGMTWTETTASGGWSRSRYAHAMTPDVVPGRILMFAGMRNYYLKDACTLTVTPGGQLVHTVPEAIEPNNTPSTATFLAAGQRGAGALPTNSGPSTESDWWRIEVTEPSLMFLQTDVGDVPGLGAATVRVLDSQGQPTGLQATTGNSLAPAGTAHARLAFQLDLAPGTYFLEVFGTSPSDSGNYVLEYGASPAPWVAASYECFDVNIGCLGSSGLRSTLSALPYTTEREVPTLGTIFRRHVSGMPAGSAYMLVQGLGSAAASATQVGTVSLPFDLGPFGAPGCALHTDIMSIRIGVADAEGSGEQALALPADPSFRGLPIYEQVFVLDPTANAMGLTASNLALQLLGDRPAR